jgi:hypothetical protein
LKNEKYFPRTDKCEHILCFFGGFTAKQDKQNYEFFTFFEKLKNISPELKNLNIFYCFFCGFTSIQDQQNYEFCTFFEK